MLLVACSGGSQDEPPSASNEPDAVVRFDGADCASTIPRTWVRGLRIIRIQMDETMSFELGTYEQGFGRSDFLAHARTATNMKKPAFLRIFRSFRGQGRTLDYAVLLSPGLYYVACLQKPRTVVVLPDLFVR